MTIITQKEDRTMSQTSHGMHPIASHNQIGMPWVLIWLSYVPIAMSQDIMLRIARNQNGTRHTFRQPILPLLKNSQRFQSEDPINVYTGDGCSIFVEPFSNKLNLSSASIIVRSLVSFPPSLIILGS